MVKTRVLIFADGVSTAHPTRMEQLALQLNPDKFEIHFATPVSYWNLLSLQALGIPLYPIVSVQTSYFNNQLFRARCPWSPLTLDQQLVEDLNILDRVMPDIVIGDTRLSLIVACKKKMVPYYNVVNCHWNTSYHKPALVPYILPVKIFGRTIASLFSKIVTPLIITKQIRPINNWLVSHGLAAMPNLYHFYTQGDFLIFPDLKQNFIDQKSPANSFFIGPLLWKSKKIPWPSHWGTLDRSKKYAYVAMGSTGNQKLVPMIIELLNSLDFVVLLSGSNHKMDDLSRFKVLSADFLPTHEVLEYCSLAVGNGGTGTTYHFLSLALPFISIPTNFDQYLNVDRLKNLGLTEYEHQDQFSRKRFIEKINYLLYSPEVKAKLILKKEQILEELQNNSINSILKI